MAVSMGVVWFCAMGGEVWTIGRACSAPKAVLKVGAGWGRPLLQRGSWGNTPGRFLKFYVAVGDF